MSIQQIRGLLSLIIVIARPNMSISKINHSMSKYSKKTLKIM